MTEKKRVVAYLSEESYSYAMQSAAEQNRSLSNYIENLINEEKKKTGKAGQANKEE